MRYSLVNIYKEHPDGFVDGVWIQDVTGSFEDALSAARDTEAVNSNRIAVAVVDGLASCSPDYSVKTKLKRLDRADTMILDAEKVE